MARKHYVAKKIGDRYELEAQSVEQRVMSLGWTIGGGALAVAGLSRRTIPGLIFAVGGAAMAYHGVTGRNPFQALMDLQFGSGEGKPREAPSYQHDYEGRASQLPRDGVEEASMESFPASDPPGRTGTTSSA